MDESALHDAVETFLDDYETAVGEYEQGYADADATLTVVDSHVRMLREAADEATE